MKENFEYLNEDIKDVKTFTDYFHFLKIYKKTAINTSKIEWDKNQNRYKNKDIITKTFPFFKIGKNTRGMYKNISFKDFPLVWLRENFLKQEQSKCIQCTIQEYNIRKTIENHIPNSFILEIPFKLTSPFFSKEEDEIYCISNPCLKDKAFKTPMLQASSLKGVIAKSARDIINSGEGSKLQKIQAYFRIFGVGDEDFRSLCEKINDYTLKIFFLKNGIKINEKDQLIELFNRYQKNVAQRGRVVFYPVFFDALSLEIINPHNKKTKAGTNPIYYEVVPKGSESNIKLLYIPYDGILESNEAVKNEADFDANFLKKCIEKTLKNGLGAKTKLGWGSGEIKQDGVCQKWSNR